MSSAPTPRKVRGTGARSDRRGLSTRTNLERTIMGVPERFMRPRLILECVVVGLIVFGLVMIYSASSVSAVNNNLPSWYYVSRQLGSVVLGLIAFIVINLRDYHCWSRRFLVLLWIFMLGTLLATKLLGTVSHGAQRWISVAGFDFQPSELAKAVIVLTAANILQHWTEDGDWSVEKTLAISVLGVGIPMLLIFFQPDKGTTLICGVTLFVMLYFTGILPGKLLLAIIAVCAVLFLVWSLRDDYARERFFTMFDPFADRFDAGYQLVQGFLAFGSGGLFGVGIGMSRQKYSYLPEAHNDFIFAVIGEECGLVGTLAVVAAFAAIAWAGFEICRHAPDLAGKLVAAGCTTLLVIQFFVNVLGVLSITPLTGKTLPFLSYGGTSIVSCLILVGLMVCVSRSSSLPETENDRMRRSMSVHSGGAEQPDMGFSDGDGNVGVPVPRSSASSSTPLAGSPSRGFRVVDGGSAAGDVRPRADMHRGSTNRSTSQRERINLGDSAADRLRSKQGPRVRGNTDRSGRGPSGNGRR